MRAHAGIRARQKAAAVHRRARGVTLIELVIALAIIAVLAGAAIPKYTDYRERIRVAQAITDIGGLHVRLRHYMVDNNHPPPADPSAVNAHGMLGPPGGPPPGAPSAPAAASPRPWRAPGSRTSRRGPAPGAGRSGATSAPG